MKTRESRRHLDEVAALIRARRFAEAMEYLSRLPAAERDRIQRSVGDGDFERALRRA